MSHDAVRTERSGLPAPQEGPTGLVHRVGTTLHGALGWLNYLFWTVVVGAPIAIGALLPDPLRRFGGAGLSWVWGRFLWWASPFWWRSWHGLENLGEGPYIIVANHQSTIDIPCLFGLPTPVKISARTGIFHVPVMGPFLRWSGQVDTEHFFTEGKAALDGGISVVVFPEGSRSADGRVQRFRGGAFKLAVETGTPILPVAMDGAQYIMGKKAYWPRRPVVTVQVHVLPPVDPGDDAKALSARVRGQLIETLDTIRSEA